VKEHCHVQPIQFDSCHDGHRYRQEFVPCRWSLLVRQETRAASPLIPLALLRRPTIWRSDALAACHGAALVSLITFLPIYLQVVRGNSPGQTGLRLVPLHRLAGHRAARQQDRPGLSSACREETRLPLWVKTSRENMSAVAAALFESGYRGPFPKIARVL
jgi:hypothetical protein